MPTRDLTPATAQHPPHPSVPSQTHEPASDIAVDGFGEIWRLFPGSHPNAGFELPVLHAPLTPEVSRFLADEAYRARVADLVRRDQQIMAARAGLAPTTPQLHPPLAQDPHPGRHSPVVPAFVWKYSAIALSTGGGIALAGIGIGAAAPGLAVLEDLLAAAGKAMVSFAVLVLVIAVLMGSLRGNNTGTTVVNIKRAIFKRNRFRG